MRKLLLVVSILSLVPFVGNSQYLWDYGVQAGASGYLGEIGGNAETGKNNISDIKISQTQLTVGGFARNKISHLISAKLAFNWNRIEGADYHSSNRGRAGRNLSFRNDIYELELQAQVYFVDVPDVGRTYRYRNNFRMYAFTGIAGFYHDPKAFYNGSWTALEPLHTEGVSYSKFGAAIPLGIGLYFTYDKKHRFGWEFDWRTTFTDYLDDISTIYVDPATLSSPEAVALSNRRNELGNDPNVPIAKNYIPGMKRGDPSQNDAYLTTTFNYSYVIRGRSSFYRSKYGSIFKHKKYKKRKIRAKF